MTDNIQQRFKEAWTSAVAGVNARVNAAEQEAGKVLERIGIPREDVFRHARELGEKLTTQRRELTERIASQRRELERAMDDAVKRTVSRFKLPTRDDLDALQKRLDTISERVDALSREKGDG